MWSQGPSLVIQSGPWKKSITDKFVGNVVNARRKIHSNPFVAEFPSLNPPEPSKYASVVGTRDFLYEQITQQNSSFKMKRGGKGFKVKNGIYPFYIDNGLEEDDFHNKMAWETPEQKQSSRAAFDLAEVFNNNTLPERMAGVRGGDHPDNYTESNLSDDHDRMGEKESSMGSIILNNQNQGINTTMLDRESFDQTKVANQVQLKQFRDAIAELTEQRRTATNAQLSRSYTKQINELVNQMKQYESSSTPSNPIIKRPGSGSLLNDRNAFAKKDKFD